jgi:hypothetical protein
MRITTTIEGFTHYRWAVTWSDAGPWAVQPSRRTRLGTHYGPPVALFRLKADAQDDARRRNAEGRPVDADFERRAHGVEVPSE